MTRDLVPYRMRIRYLIRNEESLDVDDWLTRFFVLDIARTETERLIVDMHAFFDVLRCPSRWVFEKANAS